MGAKAGQHKVILFIGMMVMKSAPAAAEVGGCKPPGSMRGGNVAHAATEVLYKRSWAISNVTEGAEEVLMSCQSSPCIHQMNMCLFLDT